MPPRELTALERELADALAGGSFEAIERDRAHYPAHLDEIPARQAEAERRHAEVLTERLRVVGTIKPEEVVTSCVFKEGCVTAIEVGLLPTAAKAEAEPAPAPVQSESAPL